MLFIFSRDAYQKSCHVNIERSEQFIKTSTDITMIVGTELFSKLWLHQFIIEILAH